MIALGVSGLTSIYRCVSADDSVAVTIGGSRQLAACPQRASVDGKRIVGLMSSPDHTARRVISIGSGTQLFVCERRGDWLGVVVAAVEPKACGVSVAMERREPYRGGCASGWVLLTEVVIKTN